MHVCCVYKRVLYTCTCICVCVYVYVLCTYMGVYTCVYLCLCVDARVFVCVSVIQETGVMFAEDPDPIRISVRRVPIRQPIRKPNRFVQ